MYSTPFFPVYEGRTTLGRACLSVPVSLAADTQEPQVFSTYLCVRVCMHIHIEGGVGSLATWIYCMAGGRMRLTTSE